MQLILKFLSVVGGQRIRTLTQWVALRVPWEIVGKINSFLSVISPKFFIWKMWQLNLCFPCVFLLKLFQRMTGVQHRDLKESYIHNQTGGRCQADSHWQNQKKALCRQRVSKTCWDRDGSSVDTMSSSTQEIQGRKIRQLWLRRSQNYSVNISLHLDPRQALNTSGTWGKSTAFIYKVLKMDTWYGRDEEGKRRTMRMKMHRSVGVFRVCMRLHSSRVVC